MGVQPVQVIPAQTFEGIQGTGSSDPIELLIASDIRFYLEGLVAALSQSRRVRVTAAAATAEEALRLAAELPPRVALVDVGMVGAGSLARRLLAFNPDVRLISMAVREDGPDIVTWAELGSRGYVTRDDSVESLVLVVERAVKNEVSCSPKIGGVLMAAIGSLASSRISPGGSLTSRELEIVDLVAAGFSNKDIAGRLYIELSTVKNHLHNVFDKLNVRHRAEAARWAQSHRLAR